MAYLHEKDNKFTWRYSDSGEQYEGCGYFNTALEAIQWMTKHRQSNIDFENSKHKHD